MPHFVSIIEIYNSCCSKIRLKKWKGLAFWCCGVCRLLFCDCGFQSESCRRTQNHGDRRERKAGGRKRESMISPSACFSSVSHHSSDPFVMLSHGEIWLGSLPSSQNWYRKCKEREGGRASCPAHCEWDTMASVVTIWSVGPSAEALPI